MLDVELVVPDATGRSMVDEAVDRAGLRRGPSRAARLRHADIGIVSSWLVPVRIPGDRAVSIGARGVNLALLVDGPNLVLRLTTGGTGGHLVNALSTWMTGREVDTTLTVPLTPGARAYVDVPGVGRIGVRVPQPAGVIEG